MTRCRIGSRSARPPPAPERVLLKLPPPSSIPGRLGRLAAGFADRKDDGAEDTLPEAPPRFPNNLAPRSEPRTTEAAEAGDEVARFWLKDVGASRT